MEILNPVTAEDEAKYEPILDAIDHIDDERYQRLLAYARKLHKERANEDSLAIAEASGTGAGNA
jgi:hypothetical protein